MLILLPQYMMLWVMGLSPGYDEKGSIRWVLQLVALILINIIGTVLSTMIFTSAYNQFLEPYVSLDPGNSTLLPFIQCTVGRFSTNFQVIYAAIFASVVPLVIIYVMFRRYFVQEAMAGAIKG